MIIPIRTLALSLCFLAGCSTISPKVEHVGEAIDRVGPFPNSQISIEGFQDRITLSGYVASEQDRRRVEQAAETVRGAEIVNQLQVREIVISRNAVAIDPFAVQILEQIKSDPSVGEHWVQVMRNGDTVTLVGSASSLAGRRRIEDIAIAAPGIRRVENHIQVRMPPSGDELLGVVQQTLARERDIDLSRSQLSVEGRVVTVRGVFANHAELDRLLSVLTMIDGVDKIDNQATLLSYRDAAQSYRQ